MELTGTALASAQSGLWTSLLDKFLNRFIQHGTLRVTYPDGRTRHYGSDGPEIGIQVLDHSVVRALVQSPELALGEAYMDGTLRIERDDLHGLFNVLLANRKENRGWLLRANLGLRRIRQRIDKHNTITRSRDNVSHHYDLDGGLYDLFLDEDRQYSCAYFPDTDMTLEDAQRAKKAHIAKKLCLEPGQRVLDIGCGWGGLAITLAKDFGVDVVGVTLSREQHAVANQRVQEAGLSENVEIRLTDYREVQSRFDRIVSVGMFEHVGTGHYPEYFQQVNRLLADDGIALIHSIGSSGPPCPGSPWISRYIFPGGYVPSMSEVFAPLEKAGLWCTDLEVWRVHYAYTLRHWFDRFTARRKAAEELYDKRFYRMWRYYLAAAEMSFRVGRLAVYQVQLSKKNDAVPLTRSYLYQ